MNERILELTAQANWWKPLGLPSDWHEGDYVVSPKALEKFAQLIVQECVDKITNYQIPAGNSAAGKLAREWTYDALVEIRSEIRETFK